MTMKVPTARVAAPPLWGIGQGGRYAHAQIQRGLASQSEYWELANAHLWAAVLIRDGRAAESELFALIARYRAARARGLAPRCGEPLPATLATAQGPAPAAPRPSPAPPPTTPEPELPTAAELAGARLRLKARRCALQAAGDAEGVSNVRRLLARFAGAKLAGKRPEPRKQPETATQKRLREAVRRQQRRSGP
jgi:hypothetical protein